MKTIILPGYSPRNKDWANEVKNDLKLDHEVVVHDWQHWQKGSFSMPREVKTIIKKLDDDKVNIIAKSVGTRVTMKLIPKIKGQIEKVILCGIPTKLTSETSRKDYTNGLSLLPPKKITCFQNTKDPFANYQIIKKFIHSVNKKIKVIEKPRSDHHYPYTIDFKKLIENK